MSFTSFHPRTGEPGVILFEEASPSEIAAAGVAATAAFQESRNYPPTRLAELLRAVAEELESNGQEIVQTADRETGLGETRLAGELVRTTGQLRSFADLCEEDSYVEAVIDHRRADLTPPRPDLRKILIPLGPVAVFGASNFPLAFSVPGGDTASALAAGCPVLFKAHPSHPETSQLCAEAIWKGLEQAGAPKAMFGLLHGRSHEVGQALVVEPVVKAVAFTGSLAGGRALYNLAATREEPIPVYAEMGSANPVFITEGALEARLEEIASGFVVSMTQGAGQFCTKPGLAFITGGELCSRWQQLVAARAGEIPVGCLLNSQVQAALRRQAEATSRLPGVETLWSGPAHQGSGYHHPVIVFATDTRTFLATRELRLEHFGPVGLLVRCDSVAQMTELAAQLDGSLTATVHAEAGEQPELAGLVEVLRQKAGRLIWNGYPTGVAVTHAMMHGGPYPATTFPLHTSVGSAAIKRFLRPVAFQDFPMELLPQQLWDENLSGIMRLVDGKWCR
ncbi:MAG TPA: aldehyde dehydrogenase (NADP(+)) [Candidatus Saccharimonadales bacterium]|nr:aldehyde dehydrogenase (NADP(+)) [Candidatus Saccharimonadales bacterium]